jgi:excisionase family DNA binding protein
LSTKPYSPELLADRWGCSPEKVRQMYHRGELAGFRLGKLIRIPANEVERFECAQLQAPKGTSSSSIAESSPSRSDAARIAVESRLARLTLVSPG